MTPGPDQTSGSVFSWRCAVSGGSRTVCDSKIGPCRKPTDAHIPCLSYNRTEVDSACRGQIFYNYVDGPTYCLDPNIPRLGSGFRSCLGERLDNPIREDLELSIPFHL